MGGRSGFSLPEILVVISLLFILTATLPSLAGFKNRILVAIESARIASELRRIEAAAIAAGSLRSFDSSGWDLPGGLSFSGNRVFSFSPSGFPPPGGSGTLVVKGGSCSRKIIVSSFGRVRVE